MFANKLVALIDRYDVDVIKERRQITSIKQYFEEIVDFVQTRITQIVIDQDLNTLLSPGAFKRIRKILKQETLVFLQDEIARL